MSYQVLARKWRPKTFAEVVGQQPILTALENGLKNNRLHHAYLFSGTRGVGKTSIARLLAKGLNCLHGVTPEPCGKCAHCKAIEEGNFIDLIEIDAASRTKVEDTRELLDNVQYKPVVGRYKVYLIDEVHMLSRHSFNALLKTLEEPPEYVKFILATTDPQKLPVTILSRCMQFHLKALTEQQISQHLSNILLQEKIPFEPAALNKIAKAAQGSIRDSLSLTDQAIAMSDRHITAEIVNTMLGLLDENQPIELLYALQQGDGERMMQIIHAVAEQGGEWDELLAETAEKLHQIAMAQLLPQADLSETDHIGFLAKHIAPEDVQFFYQVLITGRKELPVAPSRRIGTEMTLLRALAFHPKFLAATQKTPINPPEAGSYIDMPVLSQKSTAKTALNTPQQSQSPIEATSLSKEQIDTDQHVSTDSSSLYLAGLAALEALDHLTQLENNEQKVRRAEKQEAIHQTLANIEALSTCKNTPKMIALPVREMTPPKAGQPVSAESINSPQSGSQPAYNEPATVHHSIIKKTDLNESDATDETEHNIAEYHVIPQTHELTPPNLPTSLLNTIENQTELENEEEEILDAENYRWEWRNPELAKLDKGIRPSDIKQAILADITPELRRKIVLLAQEQDKWTAMIETSGISHFAKELALNCFLIEQNEHTITLGIHPTKAYLNQDKNSALLAEALSQSLGHKIKLNIREDEHDTKTPLEFRREIYQQLKQQALDDLQQDRKIALLNREFGAMLDLESVRPV